MRSELKILGYFGAAALIFGTAVVACDAGKSKAFDDDDDGSGAGAPGGAGGAGTTTTSTGGDIGFDAGDIPDGEPSECDAQPDEDKDQDGWTINEGDCNDCDEFVNPSAVEVIAEAGEDGGIPEPADEDCDGEIDNVPVPCDDQVLLDLQDPMDGARAIEICKVATGPKDWGVVQALWVLPDGQPAPADPNYHLGHGAVTAFGPNVNVQAGVKMLAVSSGAARQPTDPGFQSPSGFSKGYSCGHPQGFPKESPACPGVLTGTPYDGTALELTIRVPSNAQGFSFDFNFYTYEWPGYICSQYNDFFVALLHPFPQGQPDGNISFDSQGNPVSVNNAFIEVCGCTGGPPCSAGGKNFPCALGDAELMGTGFGPDTEGYHHGATSWLFTQAPIESPEITMRWGAYDSGDGVLDSTALVDNWQWIATAGTEVGTKPIPDPK